MKNTDLSKAKNCPKCNANWEGGSILETFKEQQKVKGSWCENMTDEEMLEGYSPPYRWSRQIGIELPLDHPNHYDGISYWQCPDCKTTFNRFTGKEEVIKSIQEIKKVNPKFIKIDEKYK